MRGRHMLPLPEGVTEVWLTCHARGIDLHIEEVGPALSISCVRLRQLGCWYLIFNRPIPRGLTVSW